MKTQARVVVIGGGVVGVGTLYHLAKKGWSDVVLVERRELTSGSTWHAAGLLPLFNMSYSVGQIHKYSVELYRTLEEETGQNVGLRLVGNIRLAMNRDRMDEYRQYAGGGQHHRGRRRIPDPRRGQGDLAAVQHRRPDRRDPPSGRRIRAARGSHQALATGARRRGAELYRNTTVTAISRTTAGEWCVHTDRGDIVCEHVVSASGNFARRTGAMVGLEGSGYPGATPVHRHRAAP